MKFWRIWCAVFAVSFFAGCAFQGTIVGNPVAFVLGNASIGCSYADGYPTGGERCLAGGELSQQAAEAFSERERQKTARAEAEAAAELAEAERETDADLAGVAVEAAQDDADVRDEMRALGYTDDEIEDDLGPAPDILLDSHMPEPGPTGTK